VASHSHAAARYHGDQTAEPGMLGVDRRFLVDAIAEPLR
jgi:hypothetical protein